MKAKSSAKQKNYLPKTQSELDVFLEKIPSLSVDAIVKIHFHFSS